jgi:hypothetical protein
MNTTTFVFGQLLSLEMLREDRQLGPQPQPILRVAQRQERTMDNSLLIIAFLIVGLIANFTVLTGADE